MGFIWEKKQKNNPVNLIQYYLKQITKEKQTIDKQFKRLDLQLKNQTIDQYTFERLRDVLEINFIKQQNETLQKVFIRYKLIQ